MSQNNFPLLLLPGLACTADLFADQLATLGADFQISVADPTGFATIEDLAGAILKDAPGEFALAGLSMGGYLAFEIIRQAPERVLRLALLDTNARADTAEKYMLRQDALALVRQGKLDLMTRTTMDLSIAPSRHSDQGLKNRILKMAQDIGPQDWIRQTHAIMGRPDSRPMLSRISCPTIVVVGEQDQLTPPDQAREMAGLIPGAVLHVLADCGHMSTMEQPDQVNRLLSGWLA